MFKLNAGKGLGDAIYLRATARHLVSLGEEVEVYTVWPEVFADMPVMIRSVAEIVDNGDLRHVAPCNCRIPQVEALDQFANATARAGVPDAPLRIDWTVRNPALVDRVRRQAAGRPILLYQPVKRAKNPQQAALRPMREAFNRYVAERTEFRVKLGHAAWVEEDNEVACEMDLFGHTSVADVFDIATAANVIFAEPCYLAVLAQAMDKELICMFSRRALSSENVRVSSVTPQRFLHKPAQAVFDE